MCYMRALWWYMSKIQKFFIVCGNSYFTCMCETFHTTFCLYIVNMWRHVSDNLGKPLTAIYKYRIAAILTKTLCTRPGKRFGGGDFKCYCVFPLAWMIKLSQFTRREFCLDGLYLLIIILYSSRFKEDFLCN